LQKVTNGSIIIKTQAESQPDPQTNEQENPMLTPSVASALARHIENEYILANEAAQRKQTEFAALIRQLATKASYRLADAVGIREARRLRNIAWRNLQAESMRAG
jgi:hypothetical protein